MKLVLDFKYMLIVDVCVLKTKILADIRLG